jgi:hypothetical protein
MYQQQLQRLVYQKNSDKYIIIVHNIRPFCSFWNCSWDLQVVVMLYEQLYCLISTKNAALHAGNAGWCNRRRIQIGSVETQDGDLKLICVVGLPARPALPHLPL